MRRRLNEIFEYDSNLLKVTDRTIDWTCKNCFFYQKIIIFRTYEYEPHGCYRCTLGTQELIIAGFCRSSQARDMKKFIKF